MNSPAQDSRRVLAALALLLLGVVILTVWVRRSRPPMVDGQTVSREVLQLANDLTALQEREQTIAQKHFAAERLAQEHAKVLDDLWNRLNAATDKWAVLAAIQADEWLAPVYADAGTALPLGPSALRVRDPAGLGEPWDVQRRARFWQQCRTSGWRIAFTEFRHQQFLLDSPRPPRSVFFSSIRLTNAITAGSGLLEGNLIVHWTEPSAAHPPRIARLDASQWQWRALDQPPAFHLLWSETVKPFLGSYFIDPLILYDLDHDGRDELLLPAANLILRRAQPLPRLEPLCVHPPGFIFSAVVADFDRDGQADLLCARFDGLVLFRGSLTGTFDAPGQPVWTASPRLKYGQVMTAGDIDADGDLDLFLGQYKVPYERGQMPRPYYDATDGHPSYILLNDGHGRFTDVTETAGLGGKKRFRRVYGASWADLDDDGDLDLVITSDFAGIDLWANLGPGRFEDVSDRWLNERAGFGMAHSLADFNRDGRLDLFMVGMNSPTVDRLEALGLRRPDAAAEPPEARRRMTEGNRLLLAQDPGAAAGAPRFASSPLSAFVARAGWAWGCAATDFDRDGYLDLYLVNGHETQSSVRDYEPEFWLHDIYVGTSENHLIQQAYFTDKSQRTRGAGQSYGGYEKNRFYWNQGGQRFVEMGHLAGVGLEEDCRNVVTTDWDQDGRLDLVLTTFEVWPKTQQNVRIYRNRLEHPGAWVGFRLREMRGQPSPLGAVVTLHRPNQKDVRLLTTGDAYRSQSPLIAYFGLGAETQVDAVTVRWIGGKSQTWARPTLNQWHTLVPE